MLISAEKLLHTHKKVILLDAWNNFVLAPVALGDGMTPPIVGGFLFLDPSNVSLGFQKVVFSLFFFADCHPPASVNGTRCIPPGQSEPSGLVSCVKLLSAGTEPKDSSEKKPRNQLCLQQGGRRVWVSFLCQNLLSRWCEIKYACVEPAVPLCAAAHVCLVKELTQHVGSLVQSQHPL